MKHKGDVDKGMQSLSGGLLIEDDLDIDLFVWYAARGFARMTRALYGA